MAQVHSIDGNTINYISLPVWSETIAGQSLNIIAVRNRWREHTWQADVMPMSEWETLITKRGQVVTVVTTDPDDPNNANYVTYYGAVVKNVTAREHEARNIRGVRVEFLVRV